MEEIIKSKTAGSIGDSLGIEKGRQETIEIYMDAVFRRAEADQLFDGAKVVSEAQEIGIIQNLAEACFVMFIIGVEMGKNIQTTIKVIKYDPEQMEIEDEINLEFAPKNQRKKRTIN